MLEEKQVEVDRISSPEVGHWHLQLVMKMQARVDDNAHLCGNSLKM